MTKLMTSSGPVKWSSIREMSLGNVFRNLQKQHWKNRIICQRAISELSKTENRIEKLLLVRFLLLFLFSPIVEKWLIVLGHIALSQLMLKIMSWNSPDKLISILWFQIWNHISNIKPLWRHYDVILKKLAKDKLHQLKSTYILIQCHK